MKGQKMRTLQITISAMLLLALAPWANGQTVTGQISGTVVDQAGAVVVGATVSVINDISKQAREFTADASGNFLFPTCARDLQHPDQTIGFQELRAKRNCNGRSRETGG